jgi:hypothetical protein
MNSHESDDILSALRGLPAAAPDAARVERARVRCHAALLARRERIERRRNRGRMAARVAEPVLVGGLSVSYLVAILLVLIGLH